MRQHHPLTFRHLWEDEMDSHPARPVEDLAASTCHVMDNVLGMKRVQGTGGAHNHRWTPPEEWGEPHHLDHMDTELQHIGYKKAKHIGGDDDYSWLIVHHHANGSKVKIDMHDVGDNNDGEGTVKFFPPRGR
jgi:hypothetical protein